MSHLIRTVKDASEHNLIRFLLYGFMDNEIREERRLGYYKRGLMHSEGCDPVYQTLVVLLLWAASPGSGAAAFLRSFFPTSCWQMGKGKWYGNRERRRRRANRRRKRRRTGSHEERTTDDVKTRNYNVSSEKSVRGGWKETKMNSSLLKKRSNERYSE